MRSLSSICLILLIANVAAARSLPVDVSFRECSQPINFEDVLSILDLELRSNAEGVAFAISVVPTLPEDAEDGLGVELRCEPQAAALALVVERRPAAAHAAVILPLADVPPRTRARTIALAVAELIRSLASEASHPPPLEASASLVSPAREPRPPRPVHRRLRAMRNVALSLAAVTCVSIIVGALFAGDDHDHREHHDGDADAIAGVAFGIGGLSFVGTSVDFGLWMRDRAREQSDLRPSPAAAPSVLTLTF